MYSLTFYLLVYYQVICQCFQTEGREPVLLLLVFPFINEVLLDCNVMLISFSLLLMSGSVLEATLKCAQEFVLVMSH